MIGAGDVAGARGACLNIRNVGAETQIKRSGHLPSGCAFDEMLVSGSLELKVLGACSGPSKTKCA